MSVSLAQVPAPGSTLGTAPTTSPGPTNVVNLALYLPVSATVQIGVQNGASILPSLSLQLNSPEFFSPTSLATQPQPVTVTLSYNLAAAGGSVMVAPLDGGTINGSPGGHTLTVGVDGALAFSFQAPARPGRYHVVTRLGSSETTLPFDVASPAATTPTPSANGN